MGKTTNTLLSSGDFALQGQIFVESLRTMHLATAEALQLGPAVAEQINALLTDLEHLLEGKDEIDLAYTIILSINLWI